MGNGESDVRELFRSGAGARQTKRLAKEKTGKGARLIREQKERIEASLARCQMTINELAAELNLSTDTIRNRINEMVVDGRPVRVAGWRVLDTTMVRIWGVGSERDEPKPVRVRVAAIRKRRKVECPHPRVPVSQKVRFRREGMDEWLFRIRELR